MTAGGRQGEVRARLEERYRRLAASRKLRLAAATLARFREIDGSTQGILVSVQLFTTVIPLMILGFSYVENFAQSASAGTIWIRELGLVHPTSDRVRGAFGSYRRVALELDVHRGRGISDLGNPDGGHRGRQSSPRPGGANSSA